MFRALKSWHSGKITAAADTAVTAVMPPYRTGRARLTSMIYKNLGTAHTPVLMKSLGKTTLSADAATSQAVINLTANPGTGTSAGGIAANDWLLYQLADGTWFLDKVASVATLAITMTNNVPAATAKKGAAVYFFGAPGDHTGASQTAGDQKVGYTVDAPASVTTTYADYAAGLLASTNQNEPLMVYDANATAAGIIEQLCGVYTDN